MFLSYKHLKLKLKVFLASHIAAMATYCATKLTATCSQMIGQFVDTMILESTDIKSGYNDSSNCKSWKVHEMFPHALLPAASKIQVQTVRFSVDGNQCFGRFSPKIHWNN